jgi:hypothetical protein
VDDQPGVKARRRDVFEMTSTGRLCHPVGFDGDETKVKIARSKYRTGSDGKADPNSKFPAVYHADFQWQWKLSGLEHPKIFDAALIFRFSSLHDEKRRISSLVRLLFDKLSLTLFASCFKPSTRPQSQALWTKMEDVRATGIGFAQKQSLQREYRRDISDGGSLSGSPLRSVLDACSAKDRRAVPFITSTSESFPSLLFKVNPEDW